MVENSCEKCEDKLMSSWFNQVMALFSGEESLIGDLKMSPNQTNRFYECVSTLIANQVYTVCKMHINSVSIDVILVRYVLAACITHTHTHHV